MEKGLGRFLAGAVLLMSVAGAAPVAAAGALSADGRVTVRVRNYEEAPDALKEAEQIAGEIFQRAGLEITWLECPPDAAVVPPECRTPLAANWIELRIVRWESIARVARDRRTYAVGLRLEKNNCSGFITIYYDRIVELTSYVRLPRELVLGHIAAHEIGHLLLPNEKHTSVGLMRAHLNQEDWRRAVAGELGFTAEQAEVIRSRVQQISKR